MKLTFSWEALQKAFEEIYSAHTARELYGTTTGKGLWLIGDDGVYLMPNTTDGIHHKGSAPRVIVYAEECNPTTMSFDEWWAAKQASFGGDDGVEFIDAAELLQLALRLPSPPAFLAITFAPGKYEISFANPRALKRGPIQ